MQGVTDEVIKKSKKNLTPNVYEPCTNCEEAIDATYQSTMHHSEKPEILYSHEGEKCSTCNKFYCEECAESHLFYWVKNDESHPLYCRKCIRDMFHDEIDILDRSGIMKRI
jgi:late competence protein required for DNA uptake (superfamily II DNA/RNA helicase)